MPIKVYASYDADAPILQGVTGSVINVFTKVLVEGYNEHSVSSISLVGATATASTTTPHGYRSDDVILISGATENEYNNEFQITVIDETQFSFAIASSSSPVVSGTITCKKAPAGFSRPFYNQITNTAVFRSNDTQTNRRFLRVVDRGNTAAGAAEAVAHMFENMTNETTGTGICPDSLQNQHEGQFIGKSVAASNIERAWMLFTDGSTFYFYTSIGDLEATHFNSTTTTALCMFAFGETIPLRAADTYASFITGIPRAAYLTGTSPTSGIFNSTTSVSAPVNLGITTGGLHFLRPITGIPYSGTGYTISHAMTSNLGSTTQIPYPNFADYGFYICPVHAVTSDPMNHIRAKMKGIYDSYHGRSLPNFSIIENVSGYEGRKFMFIFGRSSNSICTMFVDITGPWD